MNGGEEVGAPILTGHVSGNVKNHATVLLPRSVPLGVFSGTVF